MNTPEYLARRHAKSAHHDQAYGANGWWAWDAAANPKGQSIPDLPPVVGSEKPND